MAEAERIASFGVWRWDLAAGAVQWSDELHRIYGLEPGTFEGTPEAFTARLHPEDRPRVWGHVQQAIETLEPFAFQERIVRDDGAERLLLSQGKVVVGPEGRAEALLGVCHDITARAEAERALGLSERRTRAILDNTPSYVAVKDLDGRYVMTNAEAGRILGVDPEELLGRVCMDLFPPDLARRFVANDHRAIADGEPVYDEAVVYVEGEPRTFLTVTFPLPDPSGLPSEVCTIGTDVTESRERESERRERVEWRRRIGDALADGGMVVHAQPVVDLATGRPTSVELLVRMRDRADRELLIAPGAFLPAAERLGLVQSIDAWMVRQALALPGDAEIDVNLSAVTMCDPEAVGAIIAELNSAPREVAGRLVFEITETAAAAHLEAARHFAAEVTALGCSLAIDDFGTGFGSFTYLRALPLRYLKIDMSFVREMVRSDDDRRIVKSIIGIAQEFGLRTIAEGIEDQATLDALREAGADFGQGFHLGRPAPVA